MTEKYYKFYVDYSTAKELPTMNYEEFIHFIETATDQEYEELNNNLRKFIWYDN